MWGCVVVSYLSLSLAIYLIARLTPYERATSQEVSSHTAGLQCFGNKTFGSSSTLFKNHTTLQSRVNAKLSHQGFWHCHKIWTHQDNSKDTPQPMNLWVSSQLPLVYCTVECVSRLMHFFRNPQQVRPHLLVVKYRWKCLHEPVVMAGSKPVLWLTLAITAESCEHLKGFYSKTLKLLQPNPCWWRAKKTEGFNNFPITTPLDCALWPTRFGLHSRRYSLCPHQILSDPR